MSTNIDHIKEEHHHQPSGLMRWITTTNHKDIGSLYLWFSLLMFFIGGFMALIIRAELFQPGLQLVVPGFFQSNDHNARSYYDFRCTYACFCRAS
jgi:cytochrome c oxidase subunit 1